MPDWNAARSAPPTTDITPLADIMAKLRDPVAGCPWDVEQTFSSIAPYTVEEAYEVADAIARDDLLSLKEELGDLLLQVVFHARIAEESHRFALQDVIDAICAKMIRRHPHVFTSENRSDADAAQSNWENIKANERSEKSSDTSVLADVALALPALMRAEKIQKRAARTGFDWPDLTGVLAKIEEEIEEVKDASSQDEREDEIGDLLFTVVNLARHLQVDPEVALRRANRKFETRFRAMESESGDSFSALSLGEKEELWQKVKRQV